MIRLLNIEFKKVIYNKTFWVLLGLYGIILGGILIGVQTFINELMVDVGKDAPIPVSKISLYEFPGIWQNFTFLAGNFKIILAMIVIIIITNEYSYKTIRQNIVTGMSRMDFLMSKLLMTFVISLAATIFIFILGFILGVINTPEVTFLMIFEKTVFIFAYLLELFAFLSFALLLGLLSKRSGFAIGLFFLYYYVIERFINYKLPDDWGDFLPLRAIANLIDTPNTALMKLFGYNFREVVAPQDVIVVLSFTALFIYLMFLILKKRDL